MTRRRPLISYPNAHYWAVVARVTGTDEALTIPCTKTQALSLQGEIYAWRKACEAEPGDAQAMGIRLPELRSVSLRITPTGLQVLPTGQLAGPGLIESALGGKPETPAAQSASDMLKRLMEQGIEPIPQRRADDAA